MPPTAVTTKERIHSLSNITGRTDLSSDANTRGPQKTNRSLGPPSLDRNMPRAVTIGPDGNVIPPRRPGLKTVHSTGRCNTI